MQSFGVEVYDVDGDVIACGSFDCESIDELPEILNEDFPDWSRANVWKNRSTEFIKEISR